MNTLDTGVADYLRLKLKSLELHPSTLVSAQGIVDASQLAARDTLARLRREWTNDTLHRDEIFQEAMKNPDENFLTWLSARVQDPHHVSYRAVEKAARLYSTDFANLMHFVKWRQEVAWAQRLRADDNDRIAVLSFLFFTSSTADPSKAFLGLCESYMISLDGAVAYPNHINHKLTPEAILDGEGEQGWVPLFVCYAERAAGRQLIEMPPGHFTKLAERARNDEWTARNLRNARKVAGQIRQNPMSRLPGLIFEAVRYSLGSNDLVALEAAFLDEIEAGTIAVTAADAYSAFIRYLQGHSGDRLAPPGEPECMRRIESIRKLNNEWLNGLSSDLRQFGGGDGRLLAQWRMSVMRGDREAPVDPLVDYGFFLLERTLQKDMQPF